MQTRALLAKSIRARWPVVLLLCLLTACAGPGKRPPGQRDGPPRQPVDVSGAREPTPQDEPRARYGNHSPYTVNGRTYHVLASSSGYQQRGRASWYGSKFHGRRTSSGEPFDMYEISGAHRTLPLPTYVEVTNLDNGRNLIVRINDRGPFHDERIIDLSYAAAVKLGFADHGTAPVEVRAINVLQAGSAAPAGPGEGQRTEATWLQVGAFGEHERALQLQRQLRRAGLDPVTIETSQSAAGSLHRVRLGPFHTEPAIQEMAATLTRLGLDAPVRVSLSCQPRGISC